MVFRFEENSKSNEYEYLMNIKNSKMKLFFQFSS